MTPGLTSKQKTAKTDTRSNTASVSSQRAKPRRAKNSSTSRLIVRTGHEPLTPHDLQLLADLQRMPDSEINLSDIPETTVNTFQNKSGMAKLFRPYKQQITLRIDSDILAWAKLDGAGYQSRINAALRKAMMEDGTVSNAKP